MTDLERLYASIYPDPADLPGVSRDVHFGDPVRRRIYADALEEAGKDDESVWQRSVADGLEFLQGCAVFAARRSETVMGLAQWTGFRLEVSGLPARPVFSPDRPLEIRLVGRGDLVLRKMALNRHTGWFVRGRSKGDWLCRRIRRISTVQDRLFDYFQRNYEILLRMTSEKIQQAQEEERRKRSIREVSEKTGIRSCYWGNNGVYLTQWNVLPAFRPLEVTEDTLGESFQGDLAAFQAEVARLYNEFCAKHQVTPKEEKS